MRPFLPALLAATLAACTTFPDLDRREEPAATQAAYPALLPLDALLASVPPAAATDPGAALAARAAGLTSRAAAVRAATP